MTLALVVQSLLFRRTLSPCRRICRSYVLPAGVEEITIPPYYFDREKRKQKRKREKAIAAKVMRGGDRGHLVIRCDDSRLNHYFGQTYDKFKPIPLASQGWASRRARGSFTILPFGGNFASLENAGYPLTDFQTLGISDRLIECLKEKMNIKEPTVIQALSIPPLLRSTEHHLLAAETGSGKTLAFLLPLLSRVARWKNVLREQYGEEHMETEAFANTPIAVVSSPGRELTLQTYKVAIPLCETLGLTPVFLRGGDSGLHYRSGILQPMDVLFAPFGTLSKHATFGMLNLNFVDMFVLDECDTLLDDTFCEKVKYFTMKHIMSPKYKKTGRPKDLFATLTFVGATLPKDLEDAMDNFIPMENMKQITTPGLHQLMRHVSQKFYRVSKPDKLEKVIEISRRAVQKQESTLIFCHNSAAADFLKMTLEEHDVPALSLSGNMKRSFRDENYHAFNAQEYFVLTCTDLASRGLDFPFVKHVVNFEFPTNVSDYIHRVGRIGRMGMKHPGRVTSFVCKGFEVPTVQDIEMAARQHTVLPGVDANIKSQIDDHFRRKYGFSEVDLEKNFMAQKQLGENDA